MLIFLASMLCDSHIVKILHEPKKDSYEALIPDGSELYGTRDLKSKDTSWVAIRKKKNSNQVEFAPFNDQEKRLVITKNNELKVSGDGSNKAVWTVKNKDGHFSIRMKNRCLSMVDLKVRLKKCNEKDTSQRFVIQPPEKKVVTREIEEDSSTDYYEPSIAEIHEAQPVYVDTAVVSKAKLDDTKAVHYTITTTEVVKSILTLSDTTLKTIFETKTMFSTSTVTETKLLDYTKTQTYTSTITSTKIVEDKQPKPPKVKEKKTDYTESLDLVTNLLDRVGKTDFSTSSSSEEEVKSKPKKTIKLKKAMKSKGSPTIVDIQNVFPPGMCSGNNSQQLLPPQCYQQPQQSLKKTTTPQQSIKKAKKSEDCKPFNPPEINGAVPPVDAYQTAFLNTPI